MLPSKLRLDLYFVREMSFRTRPEFEPHRGGHTISTEDLVVEQQKWRNKEAKKQAMVELTIELPSTPEKKYPYEFHLVIVGVFSVESEVEENEFQGLTSVAAPAILYSMGREVIASATGRSMYGQILLPSLSFAEPPPKRDGPPQRPAAAARHRST